MKTAIQTGALALRDWRVYALSALFVVGNVALPQLCHLVPGGGKALLPIYFFTLIGAFRFGPAVGLLTALLSPVVNHLLFAMPPEGALLPITVKSALLALAASLAARRSLRPSLGLLVAVVLAYQLVGSLVESALVGSLSAGFQDFRLGVPGMLLQVFGGWLVLNRLFRNPINQ